MNPSPVKSPRGVALLLVLGALVLISAIIIGFLAAARSDRSAASFYETGSSARSYAETAVNIAIAQIAEATADPGVAWISQPGLLRTFNASGPVAAYKLYSSPLMKVGGAYDPELQAPTEIPADWLSRPDEYADLNLPVNAAGTMVYPIADPAAVSEVEGFSIDAGVAAQTNPNVPGYNPLPMPVSWIYVRKDGSLVSYATARTATDIVARIAFWGDDETCKINVNTASDGVPYDSPVADTKEDHTLATNQPIAQEYQRYPGHPATTSLAAAIKPLRDIGDAAARSQAAAALTPRVGWGGSQGGTVNAWWTRVLGKPDADRLLSGIDELAFGRNASGSWMNGGNRQTAGLTAATSVLPFFLTTESRAPELNLFNRPRITLWPFNTELLGDPSLLTPEDRLIRLASEIGSNRRKLYFQREDAWDPTHDYASIPENKELFAYLQWLTQQTPPGHADRTGNSTLRDKYTPLGRDQILTMMFDYLRSLVNTMNRAYEPVGGPVYSFPQNHDTAHTGFNDICPLLIDAGNGMTKGLGSGSIALNGVVLQFYNAGEVEDPSDSNYLIRRVQLVALLDWWLTINNLSSAMPRFQVKLEGGAFGITPNPLAPAPPNPEPVQVRRAGDPTWLSTATPISLPSGALNIYCSADTQLDAGSRTDIFGGPLGLGYGLRAPAGGLAVSTFVAEDGSQVKKILDRGSSQDVLRYPFLSEVLEFRIPKNPASPPLAAKFEPSVHFTGGNLTLTVYPALKKGATTLLAANLQAPSSSNYLQRISLTIPDGNIPLPRLGPGVKLVGAWTAADSPQHMYNALSDYSKRLDYHTNLPGDLMLLCPMNNVPGNASGGQENQNMDTFRGVDFAAGTAPSQGDLRVAALQREIGPTWFQGNPLFNSGTTYMGMSYLPTYLTRYGGADRFQIRSDLAASNSAFSTAAKSSPLVPNLSYVEDAGSSLRVASRQLNGAIKANGTAGDFTNGYGLRGDGAMVKGPDVGAVAWESNASPYFAGRLSRSGSTDTTGGSTAYSTNFMGLVYSPWKQIPSAVLFGTLPSRVTEASPGGWETLLFTPVPNGGKSNHRGWTALPRDHYWLDLFTMPVVEPYAITENFATNGKINLNQQIAPFTYLRRNTGLHALLRNEKILALPNTAAATYKTSNYKSSGAANTVYRQSIDVARTVALIQDRLKQNNDPFVSASEICEIPLVPSGESAATLDAYWASRQLTGDDKREAPYNSLYPRVTTRSNTYRIHFVAQSLKGPAGKWKVAGQYRGQQVIERYLNGFSGTSAARPYDSSSQGPADAATGAGANFPALSGNDRSGRPFYSFRKVSHLQFGP